MIAWKYDFTKGDIVLDIATGSFETAVTDNQNVALIACSQICCLTYPEIGAQLPARIMNRRRMSIDAIIAEAKRMAEADGARDVRISLNDDQTLSFAGNYED